MSPLSQPHSLGPSTSLACHLSGLVHSSPARLGGPGRQREVFFDLVSLQWTSPAPTTWLGLNHISPWPNINCLFLSLFCFLLFFFFTYLFSVLVITAKDNILQLHNRKTGNLPWRWADISTRLFFFLNIQKAFPDKYCSPGWWKNQRRRAGLCGGCTLVTMTLHKSQNFFSLSKPSGFQLLTC